MNSKLLKLKKDIVKLKPNQEDIQATKINELMESVRGGKITFNEWVEGIEQVFE